MKGGCQPPVLASQNAGHRNPAGAGSASPPLLPRLAALSRSPPGQEQLRVGVDSSAEQRLGAEGAGSKLPH